MQLFSMGKSLFFSQMVLILYESWRKSGVFILHFCIRCTNFLTGKDDFFWCKWKIKSFFLSIMSLVFIEISNFHFKNKQDLDKIFIFGNEHCYIRTSGKDFWWGCSRVQKLSFSSADLPENLRIWGIFYCSGHEVKRGNYFYWIKTL